MSTIFLLHCFIKWFCSLLRQVTPIKIIRLIILFFPQELAFATRYFSKAQMCWVIVDRLLRAKASRIFYSLYIYFRWAYVFYTLKATDVTPLYRLALTQRKMYGALTTQTSLRFWWVSLGYGGRKWFIWDGGDLFCKADVCKASFDSCKAGSNKFKTFERICFSKH